MHRAWASLFWKKGRPFWMQLSISITDYGLKLNLEIDNSRAMMFSIWQKYLKIWTASTLLKSIKARRGGRCWSFLLISCTGSISLKFGNIWSYSSVPSTSGLSKLIGTLLRVLYKNKDFSSEETKMSNCIKEWVLGIDNGSIMHLFLGSNDSTFLVCYWFAASSLSTAYLGAFFCLWLSSSLANLLGEYQSK